MFPFDTISQIYLATTVFGWGFIIVSFFMGGFGEHHDSCDHGPSHMHSMDHGHVHGIEPGHVAGHSGAGHSHVAGQGQIHGHGNGNGDGHNHGQDHGDDARTGANVLAASQRTTAYFRLMGVLNPTSISVFIGFFGLTGLIEMAFLPGMAYLSFIPAIVVGFVAVQVMRNVFAYVTAKLNVSNTIKGNDAIGHIAEVSAPIQVGQTGEVTYVIGTTRFNSAAKCQEGAAAIKKGSKVVIIEKEGHLVYVQPYVED
ncbi:MAG: NfeD family protein [Candidatus Obscuribacter sp.]|jgi:membrane protein implicated in regulation of membrane protease activity|nr:NfeD family protein [Candidatus Obscuribacter sp.]MBL0185256.1 NfeD family protein [Candidatus Obscuribacter sp.]MBP6349094.1 NfeD family protein [Candidatus Obscuribacter sp.]MBP6592085.1 NfeD family protein [Candidatus Obscuribacter sp.]MBP7575991.1 NfeD family protein [Candidatus Obscuribacter sp.]